MSEDTIILFISSWRTTNKLQLVLINVLIDQFLSTKVLQGSVSTRLRCDGIFNDQFITQSLLSPRVKKIESWSTFAEVMGNLAGGRFYETRCIFSGVMTQNPQDLSPWARCNIYIHSWPSGDFRGGGAGPSAPSSAATGLASCMSQGAPFIASDKKDYVLPGDCLFVRSFVCLSVWLTVSKIAQRVIDEFWREFLKGCGVWLNFGGDPDAVTSGLGLGLG